LSTIVVFLWPSGISIRQGIDPQEVLQYFNWLVYALVAAAYSAIVLSGELSREGPRIFSKQNARTVHQVIAIHGACMTIYLCLLRLASYTVLMLPRWMTNTLEGEGGLGSTARITIADLIFVLASIIMAQIEQKWLYVSSATHPLEQGETPSTHPQ
jgi:hypothetical protein